MGGLKKSILFLNGEKSDFPKSLDQYDSIFAADGAINSLLKRQVAPDFLIGDFDSKAEGDLPITTKLIFTPNQYYTDFHKSMRVIIEKGVEDLSIYWSTGDSHDHFLGNLCTAYRFKDEIRMTFYDKKGCFFFSKKSQNFKCKKGDVVSFFPFYHAKSVYATGLEHKVENLNFNIHSSIGTRNIAIQDEVCLAYQEGDLLVFIQEN